MMEKIIYQQMGNNQMGEIAEHPPQPAQTEAQPKPATEINRGGRWVRNAGNAGKDFTLRFASNEHQMFSRMGSSAKGILSREKAQPQEGQPPQSEVGNQSQQEREQRDQIKQEAKRILRIDPNNPDHAERNRFVNDHADKLLSLKDETDEKEVDRKLSEWGVDENDRPLIKDIFWTVPPVPVEDENGHRQGEDGNVEPVPEDLQSIQGEIDALLGEGPEPVPEGSEEKIKRAYELLNKVGEWLKKRNMWFPAIVLAYAIATAAVIYIWGLKTIGGSGKK